MKTHTQLTFIKILLNILIKLPVLFFSPLKNGNNNIQSFNIKCYDIKFPHNLNRFKNYKTFTASMEIKSEDYVHEVTFNNTDPQISLLNASSTNKSVAHACDDTLHDSNVKGNKSLNIMKQWYFPLQVKLLETHKNFKTYQKNQQHNPVCYVYYHKHRKKVHECVAYASDNKMEFITYNIFEF